VLPRAARRGRKGGYIIVYCLLFIFIFWASVGLNERRVLRSPNPQLVGLVARKHRLGVVMGTTLFVEGTTLFVNGTTLEVA
jgi:hypothetical protein